jgi:hypothetical protein
MNKLKIGLIVTLASFVISCTTFPGTTENKKISPFEGIWQSNDDSKSQMIFNGNAYILIANDSIIMEDTFSYTRDQLILNLNNKIVETHVSRIVYSYSINSNTLKLRIRDEEYILLKVSQCLLDA